MPFPSRGTRRRAGCWRRPDTCWRAGCGRAPSRTAGSSTRCSTPTSLPESDAHLRARDRPYLPDRFGVFPRRAIARELAHAGHIQDRLPPPLVGARECRTGPGLAVEIRAEVGAQLVEVGPCQRIDDGPEDARMAAVERA